MIKQKAAVFSAVETVFTKFEVAFVQHQDIAKDLLTKVLKTEVVELVYAGLLAGEVEIKRRPDTDVKLRAYASGLVDNWLRKDDRLNGKPAKAAKIRQPKVKAIKLKAVPEIEPGEPDQPEFEIPFAPNPSEASLEFSDGMKFDTSGPLRAEHREDGWYVVGEGSLVAQPSRQAAREYIRAAKRGE